MNPNDPKPESSNSLFWLPEQLPRDLGWADTVYAGDDKIPRRWVLFKKGPESWCLPLNHLVSYSVPASGILELKFSTHCMKLDCGKLNAQEVLENILQGEISLVEVRAPEQIDSHCLYVRGMHEDDPRENYGTDD